MEGICLLESKRILLLLFGICCIATYILALLCINGMDLEMLQQCLLNEIHIGNIKLRVIALEHIAKESNNTKYTEFC